MSLFTLDGFLFLLRWLHFMAGITWSVTTTSQDQAGIDRNRRIQQRLMELGCSTNSCIQTYFACMDGYLTGEPCEFYRQHPPE